MTLSIKKKVTQNTKRNIRAGQNLRNPIAQKPRMTLGKENRRKADSLTAATKRPINEYFLFTKDRQVTIKEEHPGLKPKEITKKISQEWAVLSAAEKGKYTEIYKAAIAEYQVTKKIQNEFNNRKNNKQHEKVKNAQNKKKIRQQISERA